jgi:hypothetical protein
MQDASCSEVMFLIGSGVSRSAKLPDLQSLSCKITSSITGDEGKLLEVIKCLTAATHGDGSDSYEDWCFVADQIYQHQSYDLENPGLLPLMERLRCMFSTSNERNCETAGSLRDQIINKVCLELNNPNSQPDDAFYGLANAIRRHSLTKARFFSLNHDLLLENYLEHERVCTYDCFELHPETSAFRRLRFSREDFDKSAVSLVKLHGSKNWRRDIRPVSSRQKVSPKDVFDHCFSSEPQGNAWKGGFIGIPVPGQEDRNFEMMGTTPFILAGTFNKILEYSTPALLSLFAAFYDSLQKANCLVVCGYGFGDKGINGILLDWMLSEKDVKMIVIDPEPFSRCRGAISGKVEIWRMENRLEEIKRRVSKDDMNWEEIFDTAQH